MASCGDRFENKGPGASRGLFFSRGGALRLRLRRRPRMLLPAPVPSQAPRRLHVDRAVFSVSPVLNEKSLLTSRRPERDSGFRTLGPELVPGADRLEVSMSGPDALHEVVELHVARGLHDDLLKVRPQNGKCSHPADGRHLYGETGNIGHHLELFGNLDPRNSALELPATAEIRARFRPLERVVADHLRRVGRMRVDEALRSARLEVSADGGTESGDASAEKRV